LALAANSSEQSSPGTFHILATVSRSFPHEGEKPRPVVLGSEAFEQLEHRHSGALALGSRAPDEQVDAGVLFDGRPVARCLEPGDPHVEVPHSPKFGGNLPNLARVVPKRAAIE